MTKDEVIEITKRSGLGMLLEVGGMDKCLEHFAKLVATKYEQQIQDLEDMITELQERQE